MKTYLLAGELPHNCEVYLDVPIPSGTSITIDDSQILKNDTSGKNLVHGKLVKKNKQNNEESIIYDSKNSIDNSNNQVITDQEYIRISLKNENTDSTERGHEMKVDFDSQNNDGTICKMHFSPFKRT